MPYEDGTGPLGQGPMTGRGFGRCGRGMRKSAGYCRGFGYGAASLTQEESEKLLEAELEDLEAEKKAVESQLERLKAKN